MKEFRCKKCNKLLGKYLKCQELQIRCPRCGADNLLAKRQMIIRSEEAEYPAMRLMVEQ